MKLTLVVLLLAAAYCSAAPQADENENLERERRSNPTSVWWLGGRTTTTSHYSRDRVSCGHPGTPNKGSSLFQSVQAGALVVHSCNPGHRLEGAKLRLCQSNGQWTPQLPRCVFVDCGDPGEPSNGNKWVGATFLGSIVKYRCNTGFHLYGNNFRVCASNGQWTGRLPICKPKPCPQLPSPANGRVSISQSNKGLSATASYSCNTGFTLVGAASRSCQNGVWLGTAPTCQTVSCPRLKDIQFGSVIVRGNSVGSLAKYVCNDGFRLVGGDTRTCRANGQWSGQEPQCIQIGCEGLSAPGNGEVSLSGITVGSTATYTCNTGFTLVGSRVRVCLSGGVWSNDEPSCLAVDCGSLSSPQDGQVILSGTTFNSIARYTCDKNFDLIGSSERVCQADGTWSLQEPLCRAAGCEDLEDIENGRVFLTGTSAGSLATYICRSGFRLEGERNRVCQANGEWSGEEPACNLFSCGDLEDPADGRVTLTGTTPGSQAQYSCDAGFELRGVSTRVCLQSGQWSASAPSCQDAGVEFAFTAVSYEVREGESVAIVTLELVSGTVTSATSVTIATSDITAVDSVDRFGCFDYETTSRVVTFAPGTTTGGPGSQRSIHIPIEDDNCVERLETLRVTVSSSDGDVTFPRGPTATVDIIDNDVALFRFTDESYTVSEDAGSVQPAIELFSNTVLTFQTVVTVTDLRTGTASEGADYTRVSASLVFLAGSFQGTTVSALISIIDDQVVEDSETIDIEASTGVPGDVPEAPLGRPRSVVIIIDDDVVTCELLRDIVSGRVELSGTTVSSTAVYSCEAGFQLTGVRERTCQSNGRWSGVEPFCSRVECGRLSNPQNGRVDLTGTSVSSEASYTCFPGFRLVGQASRRCLESGEWSGKAPICEAINCPSLPDIPNGAVRISGTTVGSTASYECSRGFGLVGVSPRVCQPSGLWSATEPSCQPSSCRELRQILNGVIETTGMEFGDTATYSCQPGFELIGNSVRTCQANRFWSGFEPFCQAVQCDLLESPENGVVIIRGTTFGSEATYICFPGFSLSGPDSRICQENGQWSGTDPSCLSNSCGDLRSPDNGIVTVTGTTFLSTARYECDSGFTLVGVTTRTCQADGEWSGSQPICQIAQCHELDVPANGAIEDTGRDFWDTATYSCSPGFNLVGVSTRTCQANGRWSGTAPFCSAVQCPALEPPKDGQVFFTSTSFQASALYSCHTGFSLVGDEERTCTAEGTWSGSQPFCRRVDCGILPVPKNGDISFSAGTSFGSVAQYSCIPPFQLSASAIRVCQANGEWSGTAPFCEALNCPDLAAPDNGGVDQRGSVPGATADYTCDSGFTLIGDQRRVCQANGFWTGISPLCEIAECDQLKPPDNGNVDLSGLIIGSHATYTCEEGFELVGTEFRTCLNNGAWSGEEPSCSAVDCGPLTDPANGIVELEGTSAGDSATYRCNTGFVLFGKGIRVCHSDGLWNGKAPECREINCGSLNNPVNGNVDYQGSTFGFTASYSCDVGFELVGFSSRVCGITGAWSGEEPVCTADLCPMLVAPDNGEVVQGANEFGDVAVYSCNAGFTITGTPTRTCLAEGAWSGTPPACDGVLCLPLAHPVDGQVMVSSSTVGGVALYSCDTGHAVDGESMRTCGEDGRWSGVAPLCQIIECPNLVEPTNGRVSLSGLEFGSGATYSCLVGFLLVGTETRSCAADGSWTLDPPVCTTVEAFDCGRPDAPVNGGVRLTGTQPGSVATYSCNTGFSLLGGNENRICVDMKGWSGSAPTCQPLDCGVPPDPVSGRVLLLQGSSVGARAMYNCDLGFLLLGTTVRHCQLSGEWSDTAPICSPIQCVRLVSPVNGLVTLTGVRLGATASYSCEEGFRLSGGSNERVCESDGGWSGTAPVCEMIGAADCGDPGVPADGVRTGEDFRIGATVYYECNEGFSLVGPSERQCQTSGLWSGFLPSCTPDVVEECASGTLSFDSCGRQCTCSEGKFIDCCRVRQDFASMSDEDKSRLIQAIIRVSSDPVFKPRYDALVAQYRMSFDTLAQSSEPSVSQFLPWNRFFLIQYENLLREINCQITLPYWDWTALPLNPYLSPVFDPTTGFGDTSRSNDSCVNIGPFRVGLFSITPSAGGGCLQRQYRVQMFPTRAIIEQDVLTLRAADFVQFHQFLQVFIHTNVRCFVGGQMCSSDAANDPAFLLHLAQIDFIFDRWQGVSEDRLNTRFATDNSILALSDSLRVSQFSNNQALPNDVCVVYDHPDFKSHLPPTLRFLSDALEQMTSNHELKMECVGKSDMSRAGLGESEGDLMNGMCTAN